jgi:hypothetical protein
MITTKAIGVILNYTQNVNVLHLEDVLFTGLVPANSTKIHHQPSGCFGYRVFFDISQFILSL